MKAMLSVLSLLTTVLLISAGPVNAQDKGAKTATGPKSAPPPKIIMENEKVRIQESRYKPGEGGPMTERLGRAAYSVKGGTFERTYPDGRKVKIETKTGQWRWLEKDTYSFVNIGKTEIVLNTVYVK